MTQRKFAIITGASTGIGLEIAKLAAQDGYDLLVAADTPLVDASAALQGLGVEVRSVEADLATAAGVDQLLDATGGRSVDVLVANAGHGLGRAFLEQEPREWRHVIDTNITGTLLLIQQVARDMVARGEGQDPDHRIDRRPCRRAAFQAVYNGSKAFIDSFSDALGNELKDSGVTVTCLKPGATETEFFERADLMDTKVGTREKDDAADVARTGWEAMKDGKRSVVHGLMNKLQVAASKVLGGGVSAEMHRKEAEPGTAEPMPRVERFDRGARHGRSGQGLFPRTGRGRARSRQCGDARARRPRPLPHGGLLSRPRLWRHGQRRLGRARRPPPSFQRKLESLSVQRPRSQ